MKQTWDDSMATGHELIDEQHREVLKLVDELEAVESETGDPDVVYGALSGVMDVTVTHFISEEDLMREVGYPHDLTAEMLAQHREFTAYARLRVLEFRAGEQQHVLPIRDFITDWLVGHEFGLDRKLVYWIRERESSGNAG